MIFGSARSSRPRNASRASRRAPDATVPPEDLPPKLIPAIRTMVSTAMSLAYTRVSLAGIELEEELQRLVSAVVLGVVGLVFMLLTLIVGTFTIVAAVAPEYRVGTMAGITLVYLVIAVVAVARVRGIFVNRPPIFSATLAELEKDKETMSQMSRAHHLAEQARAHARQTEEDAFATVRASRGDV